MFILLTGIALFMIPAALFVFHIALIVWAFRDANERYQDRTIAWILAAVLFWFPIVGIIVYLVVRKDRPQDRQANYSHFV
jgi:hypothetical protein